MLGGILRVAGGIALLASAYLGLLLFILPGDVVESRYATLEEARRDQLFERGWLPDILPASAHDIHVVNNLDFNVSDGVFHFSSMDYPALDSRLRAYDASVAKAQSDRQYVRRMQGRGFRPGVFIEGRMTWVFFCKPQKAYCEYTMWLQND